MPRYEMKTVEIRRDLVMHPKSGQDANKSKKQEQQQQQQQRQLRQQQQQPQQQQQQLHKKSVWDKEGPTLDALRDVSLKFMLESTHHGLKFITESARHHVERVLWVVVVFISWILAAYLIYKVVHKWKVSPILVSFDSVQTGIYSIPFPAFTICNMNKVRKSRVDHVSEALSADPASSLYRTEERFVEEICASHEGVRAAASEEENGGSNSSYQNHDDTAWDLELTGDDLHGYLSDLGISCSEMLVRCHFEGRFFDCMDIFSTSITDEGQCCSFNLMSESVMFRSSVVKQDEKENSRWEGWSMQGGYRDLPEPEALHDMAEMPLRALSPGLHMGLTVVVDVKEDEYYCSGTESMGFKVLLHTPISIPEMIENGFAIQPGTEAFIAVTPKMIHANEEIHGISYDKRGCYLQDEKELAYFKHYSFLNCFMECSSNFTAQSCGCVAYYMPRDTEQVPICGPEKVACIDEAITVVQESAYDDHHEITTECRCLPACTDMEYAHEMSTGKIGKGATLNLEEAVTEANPEYLDDDYVENNLAVVNVYFKSLHFMRQERGELYGFVDLFSNIGGLMGLCCGFSALSVVELAYFFSLRLYFNIIMSHREKL